MLKSNLDVSMGKASEAGRFSLVRQLPDSTHINVTSCFRTDHLSAVPKFLRIFMIDGGQGPLLLKNMEEDATTCFFSDQCKFRHTRESWVLGYA